MSQPSDFSNNASLVKLFLPPLLDLTQNNGTDTGYVKIHYGCWNFATDASCSGIEDGMGHSYNYIPQDPSGILQIIYDTSNNPIALTPLFCCSYNVVPLGGNPANYPESVMPYGLPFFRIKKGQPFNVEFDNPTGFSFDLHWHGLNDTADIDGASQVVEFGNSTKIGPNYLIQQPPVTNNSSLIWVHAHPMFYSSAQVTIGAFGLVDIVDDETYIVNDGIFNYGDNHIMMYYVDSNLNSNGTLDKRDNYTDAWRGAYGTINAQNAVCWYADVGQQPNSIPTIQSMYSSGLSSDGVVYFTAGSDISSNASWQGVVAGPNQYVAVGLSGAMAYSPTVSGEWTTQIVNSSANWSFISNATNNVGSFVSVSASGELLYSYDGIHWNVTAPPAGLSGKVWTDIVYGTEFVAIANGSDFITSTDGVSWTQIQSLPSKNWCGITYGGDANDLKYVVVNSDDGHILWSTDAIHWNYVNTAVPDVSGWCHLQSCMYDGSAVFVALSTEGQGMYSKDGSSNWHSASFQSGFDASWNALACDGTFVGVGTNTIVYSSSGEHWSGVDVNGINYDWTSVAFGKVQGKNEYVALSRDGYLIESIDGQHWTGASILGKYNVNLTSNLGWTSIVYSDGSANFVAGGNGVFTYSDDVSGTQWDRTFNNYLSNFNTTAIAINPGNGSDIVAVSSNGKIAKNFISNPNPSIVTLPLDIPSNVIWTGITYSSDLSLFCAVGYDGLNNGYTVYSQHSYTTWNKGTITNHQWCNVAAGLIDNETPGFVAVSLDNKISHSVDAINWTTPTSGVIDASWCPLGYGNGTYVALANNTTDKGYIMYSTDGTTWDLASGQEIHQNWSGVVYGNGLFVAVSQGNSGSQKGTIITSTNGHTWVSRFINDEPFYSVAYGNGTYIAMTLNGTLYHSTDGISWSLSKNTNPNYNLDSTKNWTNITIGNNALLAFSDTSGTYTTNDILYSVDGTNWDLNYDFNTTNNNGAAATFGGISSNNYVAVASNGYIADSSNGIFWNVSGSPAGLSDKPWKSIAYGLNNYVAVSLSGEIIYSPDASHWFSASVQTNTTWCGVAFGNAGVNIYTAVAKSGDVAYSYDGITWVGGIPPSNYGLLINDEANWCGLTYGNGTFVATGDNYGAMYSKDGINWNWGTPNNFDFNTFSGFSDVVFGNGAFTAVCPNGQTAYSADGLNWNVGILQNTEASWSAITYSETDKKLLAVSSNAPKLVNIPDLPPKYVQPMYHYTSQNLVKISLYNITDSFRAVYLGVADCNNIPQNFYYVQTEDGFRNPVKMKILNFAPANRGSIYIDLNDFQSDTNGLKNAYVFFYNFDLTNVFGITLGNDGQLYSSINYDVRNNTVFPTPMPDPNILFGTVDNPSLVRFPTIEYTTNNLLSYTNLNPDERLLTADGNKPLPINYLDAAFPKKLFLRISNYDQSVQNYPFNPNILTTRYQTPTVSLSTVIDNIRKIVFGSNYTYIKKFAYLTDSCGNSMLDSPNFEYTSPFNYIKYLNKDYFYNIPDVDNVPIRRFIFYPSTIENYFDPTDPAKNTNNNMIYGSSTMVVGANRAVADAWHDKEIDQMDAMNQYNAAITSVQSQQGGQNSTPVIYKPPNLPSCLFKIQPSNNDYVNMNMLGNDTLFIDVFDISQNRIIPEIDNSMNNYPYYTDTTNANTTAFTTNPHTSMMITFPPTDGLLNIQEWVDLVNLQFSQTMMCTCVAGTLDALCNSPSCMKPLSNFLTMDWTYFPYVANWSSDVNGNFHKTPVYLNQAMVKIVNSSTKYFFRFVGKWELLNFFGLNMAAMYMNPPGIMMNAPGDPMGPYPMTGPMIMNYDPSTFMPTGCCANMTMTTPMMMPDFSNNINYAIQTIYTVYPDPLLKSIDNISQLPQLMINMSDITTFAIPPKDFNDPILNIDYSAISGDNNGIYKGFVDGYQNDNFMNFSTQVNSSEKWIYYNMDAQDTHPFHFHLTSAYVNPNDPINTSLLVDASHSLHTPYTFSKDVYAIPSQAQLAWHLKFSNYTSNYARNEKNLGYMYHCHYMPHHDMMMMGQYYVYESRNEFF